MDALVTLALLAVLLAAPCFVQLVLWTAYQLLRAAQGAVASPQSRRIVVGSYTPAGNGMRSAA